MRDQKIKTAFARIREDIEYLRNQVDTLSKKLQEQEKAYALQQEIKDELDKFKEVDLAGFVQTMERELNKSAQYIHEMHQRSSHINQVIEKFTSQMEQYTVKFDDLKTKFQDLQKEVQNNRLDVKVLKDQYNNISSIVDEKVDDKRDAMKLDLDGRLASFEKSLERYEKRQKEREEEHAKQIQQLSEMMQEKMDMEINNLRMEMLEWMGETASTSKPKKKQQSSKKQTSSTKTSAKKASSTKKGTVQPTAASAEEKTTTEEKRKDPRLKRVVRWLFVDDEGVEEDYEIDDIKQQTATTSTEKKQNKNS